MNAQSPYLAIAPIAYQYLRDTLSLVIRCLAPSRWVTARQYSKHYSLSGRSIYNYRDRFADNEAVSGEGKGIRYDIFYDARSNKWRVPEWLRK